MQEKWHPVEKSSRRECPSVRLKCQYQSVDILPLRDYEEFLYYLKVRFQFIISPYLAHNQPIIGQLSANIWLIISPEKN